MVRGLITSHFKPGLKCEVKCKDLGLDLRNFYPLSISTAWSYDGKVGVEASLSKIKELGFDFIEISYNFTQERLRQLIALIKDMDIKVSSLHNFCPMPPESMPHRHISDSFRISAIDEAERRKAVRYVKTTIDTAHEISCDVFVLHAGTIEIQQDDVRRLFNMYRKGRAGTEEYRQVKDSILKKRENSKKPYLEALIQSLKEILSYARGAGVKVGLENRYYPNEIPDIYEIEYLLDLFGNEGLVYWHDVGHAEVNDRLGIACHKDFIVRFRDYLYGIHIHGVEGLDDHNAPFAGDLDLAEVGVYIRKNIIKVIESHPKATAEELVRSKKRLATIFG